MKRRLAYIQPGRAKTILNQLSHVLRRVASVIDPHARTCYSQEGEDLILLRHYEGRPVGFYVDVGAHHPSRFSNTKLLYDQGWNGINLDPLPGSMVRFRLRRRRDINLELGVGRSCGIETYSRFVEPALSTFNEIVASQRISEGWLLVNQEQVRVTTLEEVLEEHADGRHIDLLTIDVEGHELDVLKGLNLELHRPGVVCLESLAGQDDTPATLLIANGYREWARTVNSRFFIDARANAHT